MHYMKFTMKLQPISFTERCWVHGKFVPQKITIWKADTTEMEKKHSQHDNEAIPHAPTLRWTSDLINFVLFRLHHTQSNFSIQREETKPFKLKTTHTWGCLK